MIFFVIIECKVSTIYLKFVQIRAKYEKKLQFNVFWHTELTNYSLKSGKMCHYSYLKVDIKKSNLLKI